MPTPPSHSPAIPPPPTPSNDSARPTTKSSDTGQKPRSIQFSTPPSPTMSHSQGFENNSPQRQAIESSADEITPIVGRQRGGRKNYDTTAKMSGSESHSGLQSERPSSRRRGRKSSEQNGHDGDQVEERGGWWRDLADKYGSVELDNKGSVARDHLALERTFLAWLRTSLAFASIGIAVTQLFRLNTTISERQGLSPANPTNTVRLRQVGKPLGATFLGIAILVLLVGGRRYFESQYWIIRGKFPASRGSIFLITFVAAALIVTSLVVVCTIDPSIFEKK